MKRWLEDLEDFKRTSRSNIPSEPSLPINLNEEVNSEQDEVSTPTSFEFYPSNQGATPFLSCAGGFNLDTFSQLPLHQQYLLAGGSSYFQPSPSPPCFQAEPPPFETQTQVGPFVAQGGSSQPPQGPPNNQTGYDGGPIDITLLDSYNTHKAKLIWEDQQYSKVLRVQKRGTIREWNQKLKDESAEWVTLAKRSGLMCLQSWQFQETDEALISAFVERWHPETNSFHFHWGEISITLHDVHHILGLSLDGIKATAPACNEDLVHFIQQNYKVSDADMAYVVNRGVINIRRWKVILFNMIENGGNPSLIAIGYLIELLGSTLFIDKSGDGVSLQVLHLVHNLNLVPKYSWCAATLAFLYRQLGMSSRAKGAQIGGCLYVLHNFIWRYFPGLRGHLNHDIVRLPGENFRADRGRNRNTNSVLYYRRILDHTKVEDVNWMPWLDFIDFSTGDLSLSRYRGTLTCFHIKEAYHPERFARQYGWHQSIPNIDVIKPISFNRPLQLSLGDKYEVRYSTDDDHWEDRWNSLVPMGEVAPHLYSMDAEYVQWHMKRTHPFLLHTSSIDLANNPATAHPELDIYARMTLVKALATELQVYRDSSEVIGDMARRLQDICFGERPPPPIPPRVSRQHSPATVPTQMP